MQSTIATDNSRAERIASNMFRGLVFLLPLFFGVIESWHSTILFLMVFMSLFLCRGHWGKVDREEKMLLYAFLVFFVVACLSLVNADDLYQGIKRLTRLGYFLGLFPLFLAAKRLKLNLSQHYFYGAALGTVVMFVTALYQVHYLGLGRAHGITNPIIFGGIAMFHGLLVAGLVFVRNEKNKRLLVLALISLLCGLGASILSLSRGGWMAFPAVLTLFLVLFAQRARFKSVAVSFLILLLLTTGMAGAFGDKIAGKFQRTVGNVELFMEGKATNTSVGQRFLMWGIAVDVFRDHPFIGSGIGDFRHDAIQRMKAGETDLKADHGHAHNIFFEFLSTTGLFGVVAMSLAILLVPFRYFYRKWLTSSPELRGSALGGMVLVVSYFVFGLTEGWLARSPFVSVYVVALFAFSSTFLSAPDRERAPMSQGFSHE